jgi:hypothetical protein
VGVGVLCQSVTLHFFNVAHEIVFTSHNRVYWISPEVHSLWGIQGQQNGFWEQSFSKCIFAKILPCTEHWHTLSVPPLILRLSEKSAINSSAVTTNKRATNLIYYEQKGEIHQHLILSFGFSFVQWEYAWRILAQKTKKGFTGPFNKWGQIFLFFLLALFSVMI